LASGAFGRDHPGHPGATLIDETSSLGAAPNNVWSPAATAALVAAGAIGMTMIVASGVISGPRGTHSAVERNVVSAVPTGIAGAVGSTALLLIGLAAVFGAWLVLGLRLRRGAPLRPLRRIALVWGVPLALGPPIFSRDVYSYAALGKMVNVHLDPYRVGPSALGASKFVSPIGEAWLHTRSPYGPLFIRFASNVVAYAGNSVLRAAMILRFVEIAALVCITFVLPRLAVAARKDPARAVWLGVCNPLVLLHFVGGAHNDALMMALILAGLAAAAAKHPLAGVLLCVVAAAIKAPAALAALFIIADAVRAMPPGRRLLGLARLSGAGAGAFVLITAATGMGWGWVGAMMVPGQNHLLVTPTTVIAQLISDVVGHDAAVFAVTRGLGYLVMCVGIGHLLWRAPVIGTTRACGLAFALLVALGPIVLPWYALWAVLLLAPAGRRIERGYAILLSVAFSIVVQPSGSASPDILLVTVVMGLSAVAVAIVLRDARRWIRQDLAVAIDEYRRRGQLAHVSDIARRALSKRVPHQSTGVERRTNPRPTPHH
jgi:alpha-1,6-mannosyltransferase